MPCLPFSLCYVFYQMLLFLQKSSVWLNSYKEYFCSPAICNITMFPDIIISLFEITLCNLENLTDYS